ncbi:MAG: ATP-binding cassette domain-containing protein, partial [Clostridia bacterium]|nr:ATP-binding cassette domain-containing protein [Clostridia bacterium]
MLQIQHLTVTHKQDLRILIQDLSFHVSGTDRLAVIGEEGDGKSTLLRIISQWPELPPWCLCDGRIERGGERIAFLSQEPAFPEDLSV